MQWQRLTGFGVAAVVLLCGGLLSSPVVLAGGDAIGDSRMTKLTPDPIPPGAAELCFTVNLRSPDFEYMDLFEIDLPDGWSVVAIAPDSVPPANGCPSALPPVSGIGSGNLVTWQAAGTLPTGCGAWAGGFAPGTDFLFCADVVVPDPTGAPWFFNWGIAGDTGGAEPHYATGTFGPVDFDYGAPVIELTKTVGTVPGVCAVNDLVSILEGDEVYYCYHVENPGWVTVNFHDLEDDHLGTILSGSPLALGPGDTYEVIVPATIFTDTVNTATWTAMVEDPAGYDYDDTASYGFIDITSTGTATNLTDDATIGVTMPFDFTFYGVTSRDVCIGNNGGIEFGSLSCSVHWSNLPLPTSSVAPGILPFWDDLTDSTGNVYYETRGIAPNQVFIVEWYKRPHHSYSSGAVTFQVQLFEGTNEIIFQYEDVLFGDVLYDYGASATVGVNKDASTALSYSYNSIVLTDSMAILWTPLDSTEATDADSAEVHVMHPDADVSPLSLAATQLPDAITMQPLSIGNIGDHNLRWQIVEDYGLLLHPSRSSPTPRTVYKPRDGVALSRPAADNQGRVVSPASVERSKSLTTLTHSASQNIVIGNSVACSNGVVHDNNNYLRSFELEAFGIFSPFFVTDVEIGIESATSGSGAQPVVVNLYTWDPADAFVFANLVSIGTSGTVMVPDQTATMLTVPVNGLAPAGSTLVVEFFTPDGQADTNYLLVGSNSAGQTAPSYFASGDCGFPDPVDFATIGFPDMHIVMNVTGEDSEFPPCVILSDIPWLSLNPTLGTTPPAGMNPVDVIFDSTGLAVDTYIANICVNSDDPDAGPGNGTELVIVPVTLDVVSQLPLIFADGFESGSTSAWSVAMP